MKTNWRAIAIFVGLAIAVILYIGLGLYVAFSRPAGPQRIDCTWAEISPDIPPKAKEECRKLRMENIK